MDTQTNAPQATDWKAGLAAKLPYLGHRNWVVITDMAYPLQSGSGITTLFADEPYDQVLQQVKQMIDAAPHVFAHTYCDKELGLIPESDMPGITAFRTKMTQIYGDGVVPVPHEQLISRLDEAGKLFNIVIIKTPLTMAYTSTFLELDCNYWSADRQQRLDEAMQQ